MNALGIIAILIGIGLILAISTGKNKSQGSKKTASNTSVNSTSGSLSSKILKTVFLIVVGLGIWSLYINWDNLPLSKDRFVTVGSLEYTPNKHGWTSRSIALSESGEYRILCTSGYQQKYTNGKYKHYPCEGLGNSVPKEDSRFNPGAQLIRINGTTYGAIPTTSVFILSSGLQSLAFLPNISLYSTEPGTPASSNFTGNKGLVRFIIQRKQS